jgi:hypothetical protein
MLSYLGLYCKVFNPYKTILQRRGSWEDGSRSAGEEIL